MLRLYTLALIAISSTTFTFAQLTMNPNGTITPVQAIQDVLLGAGITATNITYNGSAVNANNVQNPIREFNSGTSTFPIPAGVHMTTFQAPAIADPDLSAVVGGSVTNGVVLEFDFVPDGTLITFNYIFASAEYQGYTCSSFNDGFGFFISGPGINGPFTNNAINIAQVPGTTVPVAINTVNSGTPSGGNPAPCQTADPNWQQNSVYFTTSNNSIFSTTANVPSYNGSTTVLPATIILQCGETYHIKLAVCNVVDQILDTGVFLEAGSFQSDAVDISISAGNPFSDTLIYRGCSEGVISFDRLSCDLDDTLTVYIETTGSAVPGIDYEILPDSVSFFAQETNITFNIVPLIGGANPQPETIIVTAYFINIHGDTIYASGTIWIVDPPSPGVSALETTLQCYTDSLPIYALVTQHSFPEYTFTWSDGAVGDTTFGTFTENGTYYFPVSVTDGCGTVVHDTAIVIVNQTLRIDTTYSFPTPCGLQEGAVVAIVSGITGPQNGAQYEWSGPGENSPNTYNATVWQNLSSGWYYFSVEDQVCQAFDSVFVDVLNPPVANVSANPTFGYSPLTVNFTNNSENASTYYWWFGNGNDLSIDNMSGQTQVYDTVPGTYTVYLVAYEGACSDTAYTSFVIIELIPGPEIAAPNTFTPNGDGVNDLWTFTLLNHIEEVNVTITNRWGNLIFETTSNNPSWNGRDRSGNEMTEGVYFYRYRAVGLNGDVLEGHGFIQLHR